MYQYLTNAVDRGGADSKEIEGVSVPTNIPVRISEVYSDFATQELVVTGTMEVTAALSGNKNLEGSSSSDISGMLGVDFKVSGLAGGPQVADINAAILDEVECEPRIFTPDTGAFAMSSSSVCAAILEEAALESTNSLEQNRSLIVGVTVTGVYIIGILMCFILRKNLSAVLFALVLFWPLFLGLFFDQLWNEVVKQQYWVETTLTVEADPDVEEFRCCEVRDCSYCTTHYGDSCSQMVSELREGSCGNGYHCCLEHCYSCGCSSGGSCHHCCSCVSSTHNRQCKSYCGTCYDVTVSLTYTDEQEKPQRASEVKTCGMDDLECVDEFSAQYKPIGLEIEGYYNPYNKDEIAKDISYNTVALAFFVIACIYLVPVYLFAFWEIFKIAATKYCRVSSSNNNSNSSSSGRINKYRMEAIQQPQSQPPQSSPVPYDTPNAFTAAMDTASAQPPPPATNPSATMLPPAYSQVVGTIGGGGAGASAYASSSSPEYPPQLYPPSPDSSGYPVQAPVKGRSLGRTASSSQI